MPRGPISAGETGFYNPAMAAPRTRSVLLLADALEYGWLTRSNSGLRVLESLCSTGTRSRRWCTEIPEKLLEMSLLQPMIAMQAPSNGRNHMAMVQ